MKRLLLITAAALAAAAPAAHAAPRVVALSPFTANTSADLGVIPVGIGNTLGGYDRFSPKLKGVPRLELSHPNGPNIEQLAALNPSIVFSSPTWSRGHKAMQELGMDVELADPGSVNGVAPAIEKIGRALGKEDAAADLAAKQRREIKQARKGVKKAKRPTVLAVLGVGRQPYAFLPSSWGGDVITKAGGKLLTAGLKGDGGFARISDEVVVQRNPDVIIAVPHGNAKDIPSLAEYLQSNPAWKNTKAARKKRIYVATGNSLLQAFTDVGRTITDVRTKFLRNK